MRGTELKTEALNQGAKRVGGVRALRALSLFTGCGGLDLAAEMAGVEVCGQCEIDKACIRVLENWWPDMPRWEDVKNVTAKSIQERIGHIDLIFGGFPCQPHSVAGLRKASCDDRDLWPQLYRILCDVRPKWFVGENVRGLLSSESGRFFGRVLKDLAELGYNVGWCVWGACDVGAPHKRERVFIVAYHNSGAGGSGNVTVSRETALSQSLTNGTGRGKTLDDSSSLRLQECDNAAITEETQFASVKCDESELGYTCISGRNRKYRGRSGAQSEDGHTRDGRYSESGMGGNAHGLSDWMDCRRWPSGRGQEQHEWEPPRVVPKGSAPGRSARLKMLGNAVVPAQAVILFEAIRDIEETTLRE